MLLAFPAFAFSQVVKTAAIPYTGSTSFTPNIATSSELRIDTATSVLYWWNRNALTWMRWPHGIDVTTGGSAPAYTPRDNQGRFAINNDNELYYYTGSSWVQVGGSGGGGIYGGSGSVPDGTVATLVDDFEFSGPDISSYTVTTGTSTGGQYFQNFTGATVSCRDTTGDNYMSVTKNGIEMQFDGSFDRLTINDRDARYAADYSATYSPRSLVDKEYVDGLITGTGSGPDSTFRKTSGSYVGKRITNNRMTGGTTLFQGLGGSSTDTSGVVVISQDHNATKPGLSFYGNQQRIFKIKKDSRGDTSLTDINFFRFYSPDQSIVGDNQIFGIGFNTTPGGGLEVPTNPGMSIREEENYLYNGFKAFEIHLPDIQFINSTGIRPFSGVFSHVQANGGYWGMYADYLLMGDYKTGTQRATWGFGTNTGYNKGISFIDTANVYFYKNNVSSIYFRNAADNAFLSGLTADASDRVVVGGTNVSEVRFTNNVDFRQTSGVIYNSNENVITVGNTTNKTLFSVWAPGTEVIRMRSNSGGSNLWKFFVNSDNFTLTTPGNTNFLQVYDNTVGIIGANNRIGIGTTPGSRFHIRQNGNGGGNGIQLTNSDASFSAYEALDASGDRVFYQTGGSMRMKHTQAGYLLLGNSGSPASKLSVAGGVGIGSTYATANAAPTNGLLVEGQTVIGTTSATTNAELTVAGETAIGTQGAVSLSNQAVQASGRFATNGDAQGSTLVLRREITGTAQTELFLDGASVQAILSATNRIWNFRVDVVGVCNTVGNGAGISAGESFVSWHSGGIKRLNTATSIVGTVQAISTAQADTGMATTAVSIVADDASEAISIRITPPSTAGSTTVTRWVATLHLVECAY